MGRIKRIKWTEYKELNDESRALHKNHLTSLTGITAYTFLRRWDNLQEHFKAKCHLVTPSHEEYKDFFKKSNFSPHVPDHERRHGRIAEEYGLSPEYGVMLFYGNNQYGSRVVGCTFLDLSNLGFMWPLPRLLECIIDVTEANDKMSRPDKYIRDSAKIALQRFYSE